MKKNWLWRLGVTVLVLTCFTACLASGTFAKYVTEANGTGTVNVAKWAVTFGKGDSNATFVDQDTIDLSSTKTTNSLVDANNIAPGDKGAFTLTVKPNTTEVAFEYKITIGKLSNENIPIKFYNDSAMSQPFDFTTPITGDFASGATASQSATVYWKWETDSDAADTTIGEGARTDGKADATFKIGIVATQKLPAAAGG